MIFYRAISKRTGRLLYVGSSREKVEAKAKNANVPYTIEEFNEGESRNTGSMEYASADNRIIRARV